MVRPTASWREAVRLDPRASAADGTRCGERATNPVPLVIVNPVAGGGRARRFWQQCAAACSDLPIEVVHTRRRGDATEQAAEAGDRLVIAVGGDGTAHEVVNGLLGRGSGAIPRVGFLQRGTGADLRRSIPAPRRPDEVAAWLST